MVPFMLQSEILLCSEHHGGKQDGGGMDETLEGNDTLKGQWFCTKKSNASVVLLLITSLEHLPQLKPVTLTRQAGRLSSRRVLRLVRLRPRKASPLRVPRVSAPRLVSAPPRRLAL